MNTESLTMKADNIFEAFTIYSRNAVFPAVLCLLRISSTRNTFYITKQIL